MSFSLTSESTLPSDGTAGTLIGRVWIPELDGPSVVVAKGDALHDITASFPTVRDLCEARNPAQVAKATPSTEIGSIADILANTPQQGRDPSKPWLLAPIDLQAIKAAGVTFVVSMLERVIEERARGNPAAAAAIRAEIGKLVGDDLALPPLLFDLREDPGECTDRAADPALAGIRLDMAERLLSWRARHLDRSLSGLELTRNGAVDGRRGG
jgi:hypothetical protein